MPRLLRQPRARQVDSVDRLAVSARRASLPDYMRALRAQALGQDATPHWQAWERITRRALALSMLLGHSVSLRKVKRTAAPDLIAAAVSKASPANFMALTLQGGFDGPFIDAVKLFTATIPDLEAIIAPTLEAATRIAAHERRKAESEAWPSLRDKIVRAIEKRRQAKAPDQPAGVLDIVSPRAIADALASASGQTVVADRLETEYRTTMMTGYNAGSYQRLARHGDLFPVRMLSEIKDRRTRGNPAGLYPDKGKHWQMDGFCAPSDDPIWGIIWPPNGWNCRATVIGLTVPECIRRGWWVEGVGLDRQALSQAFADQRSIVLSGEYPDAGWSGNAAQRVGLAA